MFYPCLFLIQRSLPEGTKFTLDFSHMEFYIEIS